MKSEDYIKSNSILPNTENFEFLLNSLNSNDFLAKWCQQEPTEQLSDVVVHFLLGFSSINTKRSYLYDIKNFIQFSESINNKIDFISQIDEKLLILWHNSLHDSKLFTTKTIRRKLNSISSLLEFCKKRKLIKTNPMYLINKPKLIEKSCTNAFNENEVKKILRYLENTCDELSQENNCSRKYKSTLLQYTIILTLFSVGMRVNELCELKIKDIEKAGDITRLRMIVKGQKIHFPIIHAKTAKVIQEYINILRRHAKDEDYLFVRVQSVSQENKLSQVAIYKMVTDVSKKVGIDKKVSPHSCRASLATILHNQGVPIGQIQSLLNHKDITTTAIYIKKADELEESAATKLDLTKFK